MKSPSNEAKLYFLRTLAGLEPQAEYVLRLFVNDVDGRVHPSAVSTLSDFVEAREGGGYVAQVVRPMDWDWDGPTQTVTHRWNFDGSKDIDVRGWILTYGPAFVIGVRFTDKDGRSEVQKVRRRGDWIEASPTLRMP